MRTASWISVLLLAVASAVFAQQVERHVTTVKEPGPTISNVSVEVIHRGLLTDVSRLESILTTTQDANVPQSALVPAANEANALANRIARDVNRSLREKGVRNDAREMSMHVRAMRTAALAHDLSAVQLHAREALPYVYRIDDQL